MSELRDLAAALKTLGDSLTSIENCMAEQVTNGVQLREGMHDLRNKLQQVMGDKARTEKSVELIEVWIGSFGRRLSEVSDSVGVARARVETLADEMTRGFREDRAAIGELRQQSLTADETTQA